MNDHADQETTLGTGVRRTVGIAALRRLRHLVDAERAQDDANARAAWRVTALLVVLVVLLLLFSPPLSRLVGALLS